MSTFYTTLKKMRPVSKEAHGRGDSNEIEV